MRAARDAHYVSSALRHRRQAGKRKARGCELLLSPKGQGKKKRAGEIRPFAFDPGVGLVCHRIGYPPIADDHFTGGLN
jgi:hypothetical protein